MLEVNNFAILVYYNGHTAVDKDNAFIVSKGSEYAINIFNKNDRRAVAKVFVNGKLTTPEGVLLAENNSVYIRDKEDFIGQSAQRVRIELHFELPTTGFNIDIHVNPWGPHHHPHPYYPYPPYPYPYPPPYPYPYYHQAGRAMQVHYEDSMTVIEFDVVGQ